MATIFLGEGGFDAARVGIWLFRDRFFDGRIGWRGTGGGEMPKSDWVIVSGVLRAVNTKDHSEVELYPTADKFDKKTYASCPGPISGTEVTEKKIRAGGLNVEEGANGIHKLRFLHGGERRAVEVFELNAAGKTPTLAWVGCIPYPQDAGFNSMGVLPNNGVVATNFLPASMADSAAIKA